MPRLVPCLLALSIFGLWAMCAPLPPAQIPAGVQNVQGLRLEIEASDTQPALRVVFPGRADREGDIKILFPEHVSARRHGNTEGEHLYLFRPGQEGERPAWRRAGPALEYERDFKEAVHMLARATLEEDGVRFRYEFENRSNVSYDRIYAVTDPRLFSPLLRDVRLERTYVHHKEGFELLASETPGRLTMPLNQWLPSRYLVSFTWPVPPQRVEDRGDGITYYNKSRAVDEPLIATLSTDGKWVVASFTRTTGNVWSNPELTCQHVDPETSLAPGQHAVLEVKILIFQGSLEQVLQKVIAQRNTIGQ